ncbi:unnamed protein product [Closterium sp. NIES-53]
MSAGATTTTATGGGLGEETRFGAGRGGDGAGGGGGGEGGGLPLVGAVALAGARGARALVGLAGAAEVVVEAVEGVGVVVGVVVEVEVSAAAVEAEEAVAVAEGGEAAEVAEAVAELVAALHRGVAPVVVSASSSNAVVRPPPPSSFVSGTLGVSEVEVLVPAPTFSVPATALFPDATEIPRWGDLSRAGVAIFDLDYDAILAAMYALSTSDEGDCYLCVPPDPGIEAAALDVGEAAALGASASAAPGAGEYALSGTASAQVLHTFTLDSGASRSFFRDRTTLMLLGRPVAVSLADPSGGPVLASFSTVLPCPAAPSGTLSGLYLPSFSTNLVSVGDLQDQGVDRFTPASQRVTHCTCARTGRHLATFTRRPGSSLYTQSTTSPPVPASGQVAASSQVFAAALGSGPESAPCSCRLLSHQTLLWHHRLGHPSLPHLRGMASRVLVSGLPRGSTARCPAISETTAASALVAELVDFAARCRLDYATRLVAESASVCPPSVGGECALSTDVLEDRQEEFQCFATALPHLVSTLIAPEGDPDAPDIPTPRSYAEAIEGPYSSQWQSAMDAEMASWKSTGTYVDEVPPPGANIVSGIVMFVPVLHSANTADIFTKALLPGDHQRFCTMLACFALLDWSCDLLFSPTLPMGVFLLVPNSFASSFIPHSFTTVPRTTGVTGSAANSERQEQRTHGRLAQLATTGLPEQRPGPLVLLTTRRPPPVNLPQLSHPPFTHPLLHL